LKCPGVAWVRGNHRFIRDVRTVASGVLHDPYTNTVIDFARGQPVGSTLVQIDHVVALGEAWQTGTQQLTPADRTNFANDPLELLAVAGAANEQKGEADAASWLPSNKAFRCSGRGPGSASGRRTAGRGSAIERNPSPASASGIPLGRSVSGDDQRRASLSLSPG
jgi:hypothetical protein